MKSYFFVSYAAKEDRRWVQRFHADLEYELGRLVGSAVGGILDTRPRPGMDADLALAAGAGRIRSMVALCSDPFFKDGWCGREWEVFGARVENFSKAGATRLEDGFLRVLWRSTHDPVPPAARPALADARLGLPEVYGQHGLLWLMRNMLRGPSGYYAFVRLFAARVIAAQQIDLDPLPELAIRAAGPAFGSHGTDGSGHAPNGASAEPAGRPSAGGVLRRQEPPSPAWAAAPPASDSPASAARVSDPPASAPPASAPPASGPPASALPASAPPASALPASDPPASAPPASDPPASARGRGARDAAAGNGAAGNGAAGNGAAGNGAAGDGAGGAGAAGEGAERGGGDRRGGDRGGRADRPRAGSVPAGDGGGRGAGAFVTAPVDSVEAAPRRVVVSYVGADQQWADWLEQLLRRGCHEVQQVRWAQNRGERLAETVDRIARWDPEITVVLLSRHYRAPVPEDPGTTETEAWERLGLEGPLARRVVRVTIDPQPLPEPLRTLRTLDLSGLEPAVVNELLMEVRAGGGW
ncbi:MULTISPECIES: toll/interleukin-1 receptor domain-containing protein [Frankia]|nr:MULTISPECIES: toll/interleukin-1 receptor domain-containing protein [Frankia]